MVLPGYHLAQPAGFLSQDNKTDMGFPFFWTTANSDPTLNFKVWFDQFLMTVTVKENVNPELLLEDTKAVIEEPEPRPETPRTVEETAAITARETRDRLARDREALEDEKREIEDQKLVTIYITMKYKNVWYGDNFSL